MLTISTFHGISVTTYLIDTRHMTCHTFMASMLRPGR